MDYLSKGEYDKARLEAGLKKKIRIKMSSTLNKQKNIDTIPEYDLNQP